MRFQDPTPVYSFICYSSIPAVLSESRRCDILVHVTIYGVKVEIDLMM